MFVFTVAPVAFGIVSWKGFTQDYFIPSGTAATRLPELITAILDNVHQALCSVLENPLLMEAMSNQAQTQTQEQHPVQTPARIPDHNGEKTFKYINHFKNQRNGSWNATNTCPVESRCKKGAERGEAIISRMPAKHSGQY